MIDAGKHQYQLRILAVQRPVRGLAPRHPGITFRGPTHPHPSPVLLHRETPVAVAASVTVFDLCCIGTVHRYVSFKTKPLPVKAGRHRGHLGDHLDPSPSRSDRDALSPMMI
jgi:hypothetical protein